MNRTDKIKRVIVTGSGGSATTNFIRSLRDAPDKFYIIGVDANKYYLMRSEADENYLVPCVDDSQYSDRIFNIANRVRADFIYAQPDDEVAFISKNRSVFESMGVKTFLPNDEVIVNCHDKYISNQIWKSFKIKVPNNILINSSSDLERAFVELRNPIWIRAKKSTGGGMGSICAKTFELAKEWINFHNGWGKFIAAEYLSERTVTVTSLWRDGELIVSQSRSRLFWEFGNRAPSGVTGITGAGVTIDNPLVDSIATKSIRAIDSMPHGIYAVDLTYDRENIANPTEINIGRFFTTHYFFTKAGLNLPYLYMKAAFNEEIPIITKRINPLPIDLCWIRGVDFLPVLTTISEVEKN